LQENGVGGGCHPGGKNEERDRGRVGDCATNLSR